MIKATSLGSIIKDGKIVGYKLRDVNGKVMGIPSESIIDAIKENKITIDNLKIVDGKLVETKKEVNKTEKKVEAKQIENKTNNTIDNNKLERMKKLVVVLNEARRVYEQGHDEIMSNAEYDKLYDELEALEKELGTVLPGSPTHEIGYEVVSELKKETHSQIMQSLAKTKSTGDIKAFVGNRNCMLGWKLDGLTVVLTYNNGVLEKAVTRGNGTVGELVTNNAKTFINLPKVIAFKGKLVLRGEALIGYKDFKSINDRIADPNEKYKNPRNLCSGSVRQLDSRITAQRKVQFHAFTLVECEGKQFKLVSETYQFMRELGFRVADAALVNDTNIDKVMEHYSNMVKSGRLDEPVDGLVITYDDIAYGKSLGSTAKSPRHSIAFKWADETAITTLRDIEWSASKTGLLNPVAIFDPVDIEGSTVSRASVHNVSIVCQLELGYGDRISVYKANMIIPQILENLTRSATCTIPDTCPVCGGPTGIHEDPTSGVYTLYCENEDCPAKGSRLLKHFVSRDAMNIDGISASTLNKLVEYDIIDGSFASVFRIKNHPEIMQIEGFGQKSFVNMCSAVEKARNVKVANLIYALSIPLVGLETAKTICKQFDNDLKKIVTADYTSLVSIPGIGDSIASSFFTYFRNKENAEAFLDLLSELNIIKEEVKKADANDLMFGKTFCVTGKVNIFPNRDAIKDLITSRGGKLTGSVSRSTDYLVTNDTGSGSRKNKAAQEFGIPVLSEVEFIKMFNIDV